jgi:hypothetical protein
VGVVGEWLKEKIVATRVEVPPHPRIEKEERTRGQSKLEPTRNRLTSPTRDGNDTHALAKSRPITERKNATRTPLQAGPTTAMGRATRIAPNTGSLELLEDTTDCGPIEQSILTGKSTTELPHS